MPDRLIIQSYGTPVPGSKLGPDLFEKYLALAQPVHEDYARRCDADYQLFVGWKEPGVNPTWNRIPMFLDAFKQGYQKVVWLDADTLVVQPDRDIFTEVGGAPLIMTRTAGFPWWTPDGEQEAWNDGVLVAENCPEAVAALEWVWAKRHAEFLDHHIPSMPELTWLLDYVFTQPASLVKPLDDMWNFMPYNHTKDRADEAVILAWHGIPHDERWQLFSAAYAECYETAA